MNENLWQDTEPGEFLTEEAKRSSYKYQLKLLDQYPRVKANVLSTWGTQRGRTVLVGLLVDDRDRPAHKVQGFPEYVVTSLVALLELHDARFPQYKPKDLLWDMQ